MDSEQQEAWERYRMGEYYGNRPFKSPRFTWKHLIIILIICWGIIIRILIS
mgnify:CR=1 FL=1